MAEGGLTQTDRVVQFLRANPGCTILDLTVGLDPFVANPRARISDARADGHVIECRKRTDKRQGYWLRVPFDGTLGMAS